MPSDTDFVRNVMDLRAAYERKRDRSKLYCPRDIFSERRDDGTYTATYWFKDGQCIRFVDVPGTLSGDILRLEKNPPPDLHGNYEIDGDTIRPLAAEPTIPELDDDSDDVSDVLALLPIVQAPDASKCHLKKPKYRSEILNCLQCQNGACPGTPVSRHITQLLGRTADGLLVFEKLEPRYFVLPDFCSIATYKRWILHVLDALACLHALGLVYRDLYIDNVVFSADGTRAALCDLECRWGQHNAPEIPLEDTLDAGWTVKSDIYDVGVLIESMIYANCPLTAVVPWPVPPPFDRIVEACTCNAPEERPSLEELRAMVEAIDAGEGGAKL
jgi:hypothetical protein